MPPIKVVIVGDGCVGKSCLLLTYTTKQYPEYVLAPRFESYSMSMSLDQEAYDLEFYDTIGHEDYDRVRPLSYPDTDVLIVCYSVESPDSLENVEDKWIPEIRHFCPNTPFILLASKTDSRNNPATIRVLKMYEQQIVSYEEGQKMAKRFGAAAFVECSARTQSGLQEAFQTVLQAALNHRKKTTVRKRKSNFFSFLWGKQVEHEKEVVKSTTSSEKKEKSNADETDHASASPLKDSECLEADQSVPTTLQLNKDVNTAETDHTSASTSKDSESLEADLSVQMTLQLHKDVETGKNLSRLIVPASVVPESLINQVQVVLQGKSRSMIIRELQRTNLDVNLAVNNLLSRDDEGDDDGDEGNPYMSAKTDHTSASTSKDGECLEADQSVPMTLQLYTDVETDDFRKVWTDKEKLNLVQTCCSQILFTGKSMSGKTSMMRSLLLVENYTTKDSDRTGLMGYKCWRVTDKVTAILIDIGGHPSYEHVVNLFYSNEENNIVVIAHKLKSSEYDYCFKWLNKATQISPSCQVCFTLTHADEVQDQAMRVKKKDIFLKNLSSFIKEEISASELSQMLSSDPKFKKKQSSIIEAYNKILDELPSSVFLTSCVDEHVSNLEGLGAYLSGKVIESAIYIPEVDHKLFVIHGCSGINIDVTDTDLVKTGKTCQSAVVAEKERDGKESPDVIDKVVSNNASQDVAEEDNGSKVSHCVVKKITNDSNDAVEKNVENTVSSESHDVTKEDKDINMNVEGETVKKEESSKILGDNIVEIEGKEDESMTHGTASNEVVKKEDNINLELPLVASQDEVTEQNHVNTSDVNLVEEQDYCNISKKEASSEDTKINIVNQIVSKDISATYTGLNYLKYKDACSTYENILREFSNHKLPGMEQEYLDKHLKGSLDRLNSIALLIWHDNGDNASSVIFNDIASFVDMLATIFNHDHEKTLTFEHLSAKERLLFNNNKTQFSVDTKKLFEQGIMSKRILYCMLLPFNFEGNTELVLDMLERKGIGLRIDTNNNKSVSETFLPWLCNKQAPSDITDRIKWIITPTQTSLVKYIIFTGRISLAMFNLLLVAIYKKYKENSETQLRQVWSNGFWAHLSSAVLLMLFDENKAITIALKADVQNIVNAKYFWDQIRFINQTIDALSKERWPGVFTGKSVACNHCLINSPKASASALKQLESIVKKVVKISDLREECFHMWDLDKLLGVTSDKVQTCNCAKLKGTIPAALLHPLPYDSECAGQSLSRLQSYLKKHCSVEDNEDLSFHDTSSPATADLLAPEETIIRKLNKVEQNIRGDIREATKNQAPLDESKITNMALSLNYQCLVDNIIPDEIVGLLYSKLILTIDEMQLIESEDTTSNKVKRILYAVNQAGDHGLNELIVVLKEKGQSYLANLLTEN